MENLMLNMMVMAENISKNYDVLNVISKIILVVMAVCALFIIIVVLLSKEQSSGIGAINGAQDSFLNQNKGKTFDSKLKRLTVVCVVLFALLSIAYFVLRLVL